MSSFRDAGCVAKESVEPEEVSDWGQRGVFGENISFTVNCAERGPTIEGVHLLSLLTVA
jgi:hypothetical protein